MILQKTKLIYHFQLFAYHSVICFLFKTLDKPKFDLDEDDYDTNTNTIDEEDSQYSGVALDNRKDNRKTHKRNINAKNRTNDEVEATVMELIDGKEPATTSEAVTSTESMPDQTTENIESTIVPDNNGAETSMETTTVQIIPSTSENILPTLPTDVEITHGFEPIVHYYYGGTPNNNIDHIYLTTSQPEISTSASQPSDRVDSIDFKPSIQYEYRNYRYDVDNHFIPIVGEKQIF